MKRILLALLLLPALALGAANDMVMTQRNATDTGQLTRIVPHPAAATDGLMGYNGVTQLPVYFAYGGRLSINAGVVDALPQDWSIITSKPAFATIATSGAYSDLAGTPTIPAAQVQSDWSAAAGLGVVLNKPTTIAGYGLTDAASLTQLATKLTTPAGGTAQYLRGDGTLATLPVQVQTDWNSGSGFGQLLNKPTSVAASGILDAATTTQLATKFNIPSGTAVQYLRGDGSTATFPTIPAAQVQTDWNAVTGNGVLLNTPAAFPPTAHTQAWTTITSTPTTVSGYGITDAGTVTSITAGTGLSGGTITSSGTISMPNTGTAGAYSGVTTDAQGRVVSGTNRAQSAAARTLNTIFQISASRDSLVSYSVQITVTASLSGGQNGDVVLEIASNIGFTTNVQTVAIAGLGQTYTLAIALQGIQPQTSVVAGVVPAGYYARLRTVNNTGTPAYSYRAGQETTL